MIPDSCFQRKPDVFIVGISSPSGGGKTAVTRKVSGVLPESIAIYFDEYDFDTIHPESYRKWLEEGADYSAWKTPKLSDDLKSLKACQTITSPFDGMTINPQRHVIFDAPLGYAHAETAAFIDFMVFIDTPLDVAMARRLLRDFPSISEDLSTSAADCLKAQLTAYLDYGRLAYLETDRQIKPKCDLILDGCLPVDDLAGRIVDAIKAQSVYTINRSSILPT